VIYELNKFVTQLQYAACFLSLLSASTEEASSPGPMMTMSFFLLPVAIRPVNLRRLAQTHPFQIWCWGTGETRLNGPHPPFNLSSRQSNTLCHLIDNSDPLARPSNLQPRVIQGGSSGNGEPEPEPGITTKMKLPEKWRECSVKGGLFLDILTFLMFLRPQHRPI